MNLTDYLVCVCVYVCSCVAQAFLGFIRCCILQRHPSKLGSWKHAAWNSTKANLPYFLAVQHATVTSAEPSASMAVAIPASKFANLKLA